MSSSYFRLSKELVELSLGHMLYLLTALVLISVTLALVTVREITHNLKCDIRVTIVTLARYPEIPIYQPVQRRGIRGG